MIDRRGLLAGAAVGLASASALAQDDKAKLRDTLLELEIASWQYTKDKNAAAMNGFLADDAVLLFFDGSRYTKAQMTKFEFDVASFTVDRASAQLLVATPDVAILLYKVTYASGPKGGKPVTATVSASDAYVRRGGKWLSLYYQETRLT
jgi:ketosteroid isomerase-like protein